MPNFIRFFHTIRRYKGNVNDLKSAIELVIRRTERESGTKHPLAVIN